MDYLKILKHEFEANDDSFLLKLRVQRKWDKKLFSRLVTAMKTYCESEAGSKSVERWTASGFWYLQLFVKDWTTHSNFPRVHSEEYYQKAYQLLDDLAYWFFMGECGYEDEIVMADAIMDMES